MKIDRHNYEAFLLDQLEGNLSVDEQQELYDFLRMNPDCSMKLSEVEPWILENGNISYHNSKLLKKELPDSSSLLTDQNFDLFSIARMEGDLNAEQIGAHQTRLEADDQNAFLWQQWQQTRLSPEPLEFQGKDRLKHRNNTGGRLIILGVISAAAAVAMLFILFRTGPELPQQELYTQSPRESASEQAMEIPIQAEILSEEVNAGENQMAQATVAPRAQKKKDPVSLSIEKDHGRPIEFEPEKNIVTMDDLQPRVLDQVAKQLNRSATALGVAPDQIEPLYVPPVPVHMSSLSLAQLSEFDLQEVIEDYTEEKDLSLWKIAKAGVKGINKLAGSNISLMASSDDEGERSGYQLKGKRFSLTRPLGQED